MENIIVQSESALLLVGKIGIVLFLIIYLVFAAVVIKQVRMMTETLDLEWEMQIKFVVFMHFVFSLGVLVLSIIIL